MKSSKFVVAAALVALVTVGGFARQNQNRGDNTPQMGAGNGPQGNAPAMRGERDGMMSEFSDYMVIFQQAGIPVIMEKYNILIEQEMLNARQKKLDLVQQRMQLHDQIVDAVATYSSNATAAQQTAIIDLVKKVTAIQNQIEDINVSTMQKIDQLNTQRRNEVNAAVDKYIKLISTDPAAFKKFIGGMQNRQHMGPDCDNDGPGDGRGNMPGRR